MKHTVINTIIEKSKEIDELEHRYYNICCDLDNITKKYIKFRRNILEKAAGHRTVGEWEKFIQTEFISKYGCLDKSKLKTNINIEKLLPKNKFIDSIIAKVTKVLKNNNIIKLSSYIELLNMTSESTHFEFFVHVNKCEVCNKIFNGFYCRYLYSCNQLEMANDHNYIICCVCGKTACKQCFDLIKLPSCDNQNTLHYKRSSFLCAEHLNISTTNKNDFYCTFEIQ